MDQSVLWLRLTQIARLIFVSLIIAVAIWAIIFTTPLIFPFIISLLIALIINKPVDWVEEKAKMPRWAAVLIVLFLFLALFITIVTFLIVEVVSEISRLIEILPTYITQLQNYFQNLIAQDFFLISYERIAEIYNNLDLNYQKLIEDNLTKGINQLAEGGTLLVQAVLNGIKNFLLSLPGAAAIFVISLLASFFISKDYYRLREKLKTLTPVKAHSRFRKVNQDLRSALFGFIKAQLTLVSITGIFVIIGLLVLRIEYAITIRLITALVDLLPYLGTGAVFIPWIVYLFFTKNYTLVIGLSILYAIVLVQRQIMEPKILANNVGLDPLVTLIALFVGLKLFGFLGLIIGPVSVVIIMSLYRAHVFQDLWKYIKTGEFT